MIPPSMRVEIRVNSSETCDNRGFVPAPIAISRRDERTASTSSETEVGVTVGAIVIMGFVETPNANVQTPTWHGRAQELSSFLPRLRFGFSPDNALDCVFSSQRLRDKPHPPRCGSEPLK